METKNRWLEQKEWRPEGRGRSDRTEVRGPADQLLYPVLLGKADTPGTTPTPLQTDHLGAGTPIA